VTPRTAAPYPQFHLSFPRKRESSNPGGREKTEGGGYWIARSSRAMTGLVGEGYPRSPNLLYPASTSSSEGRFHEAFVTAGRGAAPAGLAQQGTRAASELPPGPLGVPARSWLTRPEAEFDPASWTKAGPDAGNVRNWRAERCPPRSQKDRGAIGLRFSARHPLYLASSRRRENFVLGESPPLVMPGFVPGIQLGGAKPGLVSIGWPGQARP
jgi:hypothetical protein